MLHVDFCVPFVGLCCSLKLVLCFATGEYGVSTETGTKIYKDAISHTAR